MPSSTQRGRPEQLDRGGRDAAASAPRSRASPSSSARPPGGPAPSSSRGAAAVQRAPPRPRRAAAAAARARPRVSASSSSRSSSHSTTPTFSLVTRSWSSVPISTAQPPSQRRRRAVRAGSRRPRARPRRSCRRRASRARRRVMPGRVERRDEHGEPAVARRRAGADGEVDPVGDLGARRPQLAAGDDEAVAARRARWCAATARSEPASGSEKPWQNSSRPAAISGSSRSCSSGAAKRSERVADRLDRQQVAGERQPVVAEALLARDGVQRRAARAPPSCLRPVQADPARLAERRVRRARVAVGRHPLPAQLRLVRDPRGQRRRERVRLAARARRIRGASAAMCGEARLDPRGDLAQPPDQLGAERARRARGRQRRR